MALISTPMPDVGGAKSLEEKFQILLDNYYQLRKELSYSISNLGMDNFTTTIKKELENVTGVVGFDGKIIAAKIAGILSTAITTIQNASGTIKFTDNSIMIHNLPSETDSTEAMMLTSAGFLIASEKDIDGNWIWETAISGKSVSADAMTTGTLTAINIDGVNITGSTMLVRHNDGSSTKIDGSGITRIFSVPIFEQLATDADIIVDFETGLLADARIDIPASWHSYNGEYYDSGYYFTAENIQDYITIVQAEKYSGTYGLKIRAEGLSSSTATVMCSFINYRPTKDTELSLKYKTILAYDSNAQMSIQNMDTPNVAAETVPLSSNVWATASISLTKNVTYRLGIRLQTGEDNESIIYIDDIVFEENVNEPVIVGNTISEQPYYDFTYIRKGHFEASGTQQIILPDYFKGLKFDVFLTPCTNWKWSSLDDTDYAGVKYYTIYPTTMSLLSVNDAVPSFTVQYSCDTSATPADFLYTVVLNN